MEISPYDGLWIAGGVFMSLSALLNFGTCIMNYLWTCFGASHFGWEMDVVYGSMFFTYPYIPFSKVEGTCALFLAVGGFLSWAEDPTIQCVSLLLQVFGSGYWIVCIFYGALVKDKILMIFSAVLVAVALGSAFTRGPGYVFKEKADLEIPFWLISGVILSISLAIGIAGSVLMNDEKWKLVKRNKAITKYLAENKDSKWPVENAYTTEGGPDGFKMETVEGEYTEENKTSS